VPKPDIFQLLVDSALRPELCRRLADAPDTVFGEYDLDSEERELLRHPDHRLLPLLGAALARTTGLRPVDPGPPNHPDSAPDPCISQLLPDSQMALTVVPCVVGDRIAFATWITPMHEGADPSRLPPPAGATLPGQPLTPLYGVIQLTAAQSKDAAGNAQVSMWAAFRQSSNTVAAAPAETAGNPERGPFGSAMESVEVRAAVAAVREAARGDRYDKLVALTRALRGGDVR
jgi:hypothetical protein